jgi:hypothetical protein
MGGGYINCGDFSGDDKSCSAISGVFDELPSSLKEHERNEFVTNVLGPLQSQLEETGEYFLIPPEVARKMLPVVQTLYEKYRNIFLNKTVWDAIASDDDSGIDPSEAKWGAGPGWRYYCLTDLLKGLQQSIETNTDVCISFD